MIASPPELSRVVRLDEIGRTRWPVTIVADEAERAALAERFGYASIDALAAEYSLSREGAAVVATGRITASLSQPCIATGEPVPETVDEPFAIRFVPEDAQGAGEPGEEIELDADECDVVTFGNDRIDMGEAVAETLALSVEPYPRSDSADAFLREAGVLTEEQAGPFAALAALKGLAKRGS